MSFTIVANQTPGTDKHLFRSSLKENNYDTPWYEVLQVNNTKLKFKLDSGANVTIISEHDYENMKTKTKVETN